jgi:hypothetical protein
MRKKKTVVEWWEPTAQFFCKQQNKKMRGKIVVECC